jgi:hypothetical protein
VRYKGWHGEWRGTTDFGNRAYPGLFAGGSGLESRPRYGETLTLLIEGKRGRAQVIGVWQDPPWPASGIYMINADEIE